MERAVQGLIHFLSRGGMQFSFLLLHFDIVVVVCGWLFVYFCFLFVCFLSFFGGGEGRG